MKKFFSLLLCICIILGTVTITYAKTGDTLGYAKYTDISAYINHYPITSYNINGYTAVVAEDLQNYGFSVVWDAKARSLSITKNPHATEITPYGTVYKYSDKAGKNSSPYLETDISTYVNGEKVESFNIDGKTCVYIEDLAVCGEIVWVPETRAIKLWIEKLPIKNYSPIPEYNTTPSTSKSISSLYYPGTTIPDYTYVTGIALKDIYTSDATIYIYPDTKYGKYSEVVDYLGYLKDSGWSEYKKQEENYDITWFYTKNKTLVGVTFSAEYDEIWITTLNK